MVVPFVPRLVRPASGESTQRLPAPIRRPLSEVEIAHRRQMLKHLRERAAAARQAAS